MKMFIFSGEIITSQDVFHQSSTRYMFTYGACYTQSIIICIGHGKVCGDSELNFALWLYLYINGSINGITGKVSANCRNRY